MNAVQLTRPGTVLIYTFDWSADTSDTINLLSVTNILPVGAELTLEQIDAPTSRSTVKIKFDTPGLYQVIALAVLDNGETVPDSFTVRVSAAS